MSEYGTYDELVAELRQTQRECRRMMEWHGNFLADLTWAAFGHRDALTHEQIIESLRELRRTANMTNLPERGAR